MEDNELADKVHDMRLELRGDSNEETQRNISYAIKVLSCELCDVSKSGDVPY